MSTHVHMHAVEYQKESSLKTMLMNIEEKVKLLGYQIVSTSSLQNHEWVPNSESKCLTILIGVSTAGYYKVERIA